MIRIKPNADPFSPQADPDNFSIEPILADSSASQLFKQELKRYCNGEIKGRSFLVAGHRGSGKTTMVENALLEYKRDRPANDRSEQIMMKPLPIYLLGPTLLEIDAEKIINPATPATRAKAQPQTMTVAVNVAGESISQASAQKPRDDELFMNRVLIQVVFGMHQALCKELVSRFYARANSDTILSSKSKDNLRLAAQFEIELTEAPSPSRLFEFWSRIGALKYGLLFDHNDLREDKNLSQGMRELVALCGVVHAHQRISGDLKETDDQRTGRSKVSETAAGLEIGNMAILKPLTAIASGAAVATAATASGNPWAALPLGLLTALGASLFIRMSSVTQFRRERKIDRTFIPDFSIKTLHRLIPTLIDRLKAARLAPVFIIDELDKVDDLDERLAPLLKSLKKLATESSFTCLLVDRGYYENLHINEEREQDQSVTDNGDPGNEGVRKSAFGRHFSYYSHRILVAFLPVDFHDYLIKLLETTNGDSVPASQDTRQMNEESENLDLELIRWVLLHRSQLNSLSLNRLLEAWRGAGNILQIPQGGTLRSAEAYRIELTLQFAVELELADPKTALWLDKRPRLHQALMDAAYYVSREWLEQDRAKFRGKEANAPQNRFLDLTKAGLPAFRAYLLHRMNLHADDSPTTDQQLINKRNLQRSDFDLFALRADEVETLFEVAIGIARSVAYSTDSDGLKKKWLSCAEQRRMSKPSQGLYDALLFGHEKSVLVPTVTNDTACLQFRWRYLPSGNESQTTSLQIIFDKAKSSIESIASIETLLNAIFEISASSSAADSPFRTLADNYRVLPTTPAWSQVESARNRIEQAGKGYGNKTSLNDELSVVKEFANLITNPRVIETVIRALINGAYLGVAESQPSGSTALRMGMQILSEALQFKECSLIEVLSRLESFQSELQALYDQPNKLLDPKSIKPMGWPPEKIFAQYIEAALRMGSTDRANPSEPIVNQAWSLAAKRLQAFIRANKPQSAHAVEIVCAARGIGPGKMLDLNLSRMTLRRWTSALIDALTPSPANDLTKCPLWVAAYALDRLGICGMGPDSQNALIGSLEQAGYGIAELRLHVESTGLWRGDGAQRRVALVICGDKISMTDNWVAVPNRGLILVTAAKTVTEIGALKIAQQLKWDSKSSGSNPVQLVLAWEPLAATENGEKLIREDIRLALPSTPISDVWLYRGRSLGAKSPQIVDPASADDFWNKYDQLQRSA